MSNYWPYVVEQGDYLDKIAARLGASADEIWSHPKNEPLKKQGRTPNILHPGDILFVPEAKHPERRRVKIGAYNFYRAEVPKTEVKLRVHGDDGPMKGAKWIVDDMFQTLEGTTDDEGTITFKVALTREFVIIKLPEHDRVMRLDIGHLDPATAASGVRARLEHLGYLDPGDASPQGLTKAIADFQKDHDLEETGELDSESFKQLVEAHGS
jgi:hypothetical protein